MSKVPLHQSNTCANMYPISERVFEGDTMANPAEAAGTGSSIELISASEPEIKNLIYTVRGQQVMLDSDLARLYGVETKALNRAAKRNEDRFPADFRFQLSDDEYSYLRCQFGTSCDDLHEFGSGGRRYTPIVYTEQGIAMLSAVLRSKVAVEVSVRIIRAFVEMRHFIASNAAMFERIRDVELRQLEDHHSLAELQKSTDERFERVFDFMEAHEAPKQRLYFEGQIYDAFELLVSLVQRAKHKIVLVDGYVDVATLNVLAKKKRWGRGHHLDPSTFAPDATGRGYLQCSVSAAYGTAHEFLSRPLACP